MSYSMSYFRPPHQRDWHTVSRNLQLHVSLKPEPGSNDLALESPYDAAFVEAFKQAVPGTGRRWDKDGKRWLISPAYAPAVIALVKRVWGIDLPAPEAPSSVTREVRLSELEYLGAAKPRAGWDELVAYGFSDGDWRLVFPVSVLLTWFMPGELRPDEARTLYGVLGIGRGVGVEEIKRAYRRAARTWHPDVCKEPDATEQFQRLQHAYSVLSDETMRRKYDCGLALAERATEVLPPAGGSAWRPPLRCGLVMAEGTAQLGRFVVSKVIAWEDVVDDQGRCMVTTWPAGADMFHTRWV